MFNGEVSSDTKVCAYICESMKIVKGVPAPGQVVKGMSSKRAGKGNGGRGDK